MGQGNDKKTEDYLAAFSLKSPPARLKEKIIDGVRKKQNPNHAMNIFLWKGLVGCLLLLIFVVAIDAVITRAQNKRFSSLVEKDQDYTFLTEEDRALIKDIIGEFSSATKSGANLNLQLLLEKNKKRKRQIEWRESIEKEIE